MPLLVAWLLDGLGKTQGRYGTGSAIISWMTWYRAAVLPNLWKLLQVVAPVQHTYRESIKHVPPLLPPTTDVPALFGLIQPIYE